MFRSHDAAIEDEKGKLIGVLLSSGTEEKFGVDMLACGLLLCLLAGLPPGCRAYPPDEVTDLPGMTFKPNYRQWSGYLQARPGKFLHYW